MSKTARPWVLGMSLAMTIAALGASGCGSGNGSSVSTGGGSGGTNPTPTPAPTPTSSGTLYGPTLVSANALPRAMLAGDFNADGKADLVTANTNASTVSVLLGDGKGGYTLAPFTNAYAAANAVATADFNGDKLPDLALASANNTVQILLGNGAGGFVPVTSAQPATDFNPQAIVAGDYNGDGRADLVTANADPGTLTVLLGNGDGTFATGVKYAGQAKARSLVQGDFNGDGKTDLAIGSSQYRFTVLFGDGTGAFNTGTTLYTRNDPNAQTGNVSTVTTDLNGDGRLDLATLNQGAGTVTVLLGDGTGNFALVGDGSLTGGFATGPRPSVLVAGDFNGDGKADLATANQGAISGANAYDGTLTILLGDGTGKAFTAAAGTPLTGTTPVALVGTDANGDGVADLAIANQGSLGTDGGATAQTGTVTVALNDGAGRLSTLAGTLNAGITTNAAGGVASKASPTAVLSADFNGDGIPDLASPDTDTKLVSLFLGDGRGGFARFAYTATLPPSAGNDGVLAVGDVNGDGKPDLVAGNSQGNGVIVLLGSGKGDFTAKTLNLGVNSPIGGIAIADVNGDSRPDIALTDTGTNTLTVALGDGTGAFAATATQPAAGQGPTALVAADFNADGKLDLAATNRDYNSVTVLKGDGAGGFITSATLPTGSRPLHLVALDVNGDGKLDLATANQDPTASSTVFKGDGKGGFTQVSAPTAGAAYSVATADMNGDTRADLVLTRTDSSVVVLLGDGTGGFTAATPTSATGRDPFDLCVADFNGDKRLDVATANVTDNTFSVLLGRP